MGYELNTEAYKFLIQIEVGLREFLIEIIKQKGIQEWFNEFLGSQQRDTINNVINYTVNGNGDDKIDVSDRYIINLKRSLKINDSILTLGKLFHPFYYLNWTDMETLMKMKLNTILIEESIGKINREAIVENLKAINYLRNDIAHSRFISNNDLKIIKATFEQIDARIPNFNSFIGKQTEEDSIETLFLNINENINTINSNQSIEIETIDSIIINIQLCLNSFWLNSLYDEMIEFLKKFCAEMVLYKKYKNSLGGILEIAKWHKKNTGLLLNLTNILNNGKI
jgi:hypothetical protein